VLVWVGSGRRAGVAAAGGTTETRASLAELCHLYWPPVYSFLRRSGRSTDDARDLTQSFFAGILARNDLATADPQRGRFRGWLLGALKHFLSNERRRARTKKRGGGAIAISIDRLAAEEIYARELTDSLTPERMYVRRWALAMLDHVMRRLEREYVRTDKRMSFERLKCALVGDEPSYDALADELGQAAGTLRVQVFRLRRRYRDLLHQEIAQTVMTSNDVNDELRYLFSALL
jgi:RNA polymerase sigma factor (sigma-70 family)